MRQKSVKPNLNWIQKEAIERARKGDPYPLEKQIKSLQSYIIRLAPPDSEDELGRWRAAMRKHYGMIVGMLKQARKDFALMNKGKSHVNI